MDPALLDAAWTGLLFTDTDRIVPTRAVDFILPDVTKTRFLVTFQDWWKTEPFEPFAGFVHAPGELKAVDGRWQLVNQRDAFELSRANTTDDEQREAQRYRRECVVLRPFYRAAITRLGVILESYPMQPWLDLLDRAPAFHAIQQRKQRQAAWIKALSPDGAEIDRLVVADDGEAAQTTGAYPMFTTAADQWQKGMVNTDPLRFLEQVVAADKLGQAFSTPAGAMTAATVDELATRP